MQFRDLKRFKPHIQTGDRSAFPGHAFCQDAAAAADIQHFLTKQAA